jgi:hypothetical protein
MWYAGARNGILLKGGSMPKPKRGRHKPTKRRKLSKEKIRQLWLINLFLDAAFIQRGKWETNPPRPERLQELKSMINANWDWLPWQTRNKIQKIENNVTRFFELHLHSQ